MANFLGKKISLISKAGIRYEGILYTIDQSAFTVALSKVKSFGTEDRPTDRFIAARDEVYEYIIFRGSDISDLHVCENSLYTDDSAIVKIMSPNTTNPSSPPIASAQFHEVNVPDSQPHHDEPASPAKQQQISISKRFMNFSKVNNRNEEHGSGNNQDQSNQRHNRRDQTYNEKYDSEDLEEIAAHDYRQFQNREQTSKTDFYDHFTDDSYRFSNVRRPTQRQQGFRNTEPNRGAAYNRGYGGAAVNRNFRSNKDAPIDTIKDDFDFETSNALMAEELAHMNISHEVAREMTKGDTLEDEENSVDDGEEEKVFYDKSKSFFDNISSEVTDRSGGVSDRRHKNNIETFGASEYGRGNRGYRSNNGRWNGSRGPFRGNYGRGSSAGFLRRGGNTQRGDGRMNRGGPFGQSNPRRPVAVGGGGGTGTFGFSQDN